jgi:hypothetical protein
MSKDDLVIDDFKLSLDYLKSQYDRLWQRFNYFLTIEMALFGFFGWLAFEKGNFAAARLPALVGMFVSFIWYATAAEDQALVEAYRSRVIKAAETLARQLSLDPDEYLKSHTGAAVPSHFSSLLSWYWRPISVTRLPVWIALIHVLIWATLTFFGVVLLKHFFG